MKTTNRFILGLTSSLLLAAGFARAADRLDPVVNHSASSSANLQVADGCSTQCWAIENETPMQVADGCSTQCWAIGDGS